MLAKYVYFNIIIVVKLAFLSDYRQLHVIPYCESFSYSMQHVEFCSSNVE